MRTSQSIVELATSLSIAQGQMTGAVKGSKNPFFKSSYADIKDVINAIREPFNSNGLSYTQFPINKNDMIGVVTRIMHSSGEWLESEFFLPVGKKDAQGYGSAITYARRYALQSMAGIPSVDDDGNSSSSSTNKVIYKVETVTDKESKELSDFCSKIGNSRKFLANYSVEKFSDLPKDKFKEAMATLNKYYDHSGASIVEKKSLKDNVSEAKL